MVAASPAPTGAIAQKSTTAAAVSEPKVLTQTKTSSSQETEMPAIIPTNGMIDLGGEDESESIGIESEEVKVKKE